MLKKLFKSQTFKHHGKLHTLNSGATCALFRDSSKLKQKSTSASASLSTKFCSSEKEKLMMWHTKHKHPVAQDGIWAEHLAGRAALNGKHILEFSIIKISSLGFLQRWLSNTRRIKLCFTLAYLTTITVPSNPFFLT